MRYDYAIFVQQKLCLAMAFLLVGLLAENVIVLSFNNFC